MIACTDLQVAYDGRTVLHGLTLQVKAGELVAVIGPNGSGKTTLMRALTGIVPLAAGRVSVQGTPLGALSSRERAQRIAVVSQRTEAVPDVRVIDVVLMGRYAHVPWHAGYSRKDEALARSALTRTSTLHLAERRAPTLSGGELQRVLVARALAQCAPILMLDEPAVGLDPARMLELFELLEARRAEGAAIVAVLHDINLAALYATRLVGLREGQLCFEGPPAQVFEPQRLSELYAVPFMVYPHPITGTPQACLVPPQRGGTHASA